MKGDIPKHEERLVFKQYTFTVESVDKTRVKRIKITIDE
jgi:CBS domain containing-hemolysin-like protein